MSLSARPVRRPLAPHPPGRAGRRPRRRPRARSRVPCFRASRAPGRSGRSESQQTSAPNERVTGSRQTRRRPARRRATRSSSRSRRTDTDWPASGRLERPVQRLDRGDACALAARAARRPHHPAAARRRRRGRRRRAPRRAAPTAPGSAARAGAPAGSSTVSRCSSSGGPAYQASRSDALDHVVAVQRAQRQRRHRAEPDLRGEAVEVGHDAVEDLLRPVDEVHLVDRQHDVTDTQQPCHRRVPACLLDHAVACVDQHDRHLRRRGAGDHVARVLLVARRVGEDEAPPRGREVAVRDVDRDALLALGAQPVGQQRQVQVTVAVARVRHLRDVLELVGQDRLRVVEQPPDQRRLPVVHRAGRRQPQRVDLARSSRQPCGPPSRPRTLGRRRASRRAR